MAFLAITYLGHGTWWRQVLKGSMFCSFSDTGEELRTAEVPERPGPHGTGSQAQPHRHPGQDLVPKQEVLAQTD